MEWINCNVSNIQNFIENNLFYVEPLLKKGGIHAPFANLLDCKNAYIKLQNLWKNKKVLNEDKEILFYSFSFAMVQFIVKEKGADWELKPFMIGNNAHVLPFIIMYNANQVKKIINPYSTTFRCINSKPKLSFEFYYWRISDTPPIEQAIYL